MAKLTLEIPSGSNVEDLSSISTTERTYGVDHWNAKIKKVGDSLTPLSIGVIKRDGTEYMRGRFKSPKKVFGAGVETIIKGQGYSGELNRFLTGSGTITSKTVVEAIQEVLDESPSAHGITLDTVDTFYFIGTIWEYKTTVEFLTWEYNNTGIEFDVDESLEVDDGRPDGVNADKLPFGNLRCEFVDKRGRIFVFYTDAGNNVYYTSSTDGGATWETPTDTGHNSSGAILDATYDIDEDHVHLTHYTGGRTEIDEGSISGSVITLVLQNNNIFGANRSSRCSVMYGNEDEHIWTIDSANHLWESIDDGANWTDHGVLSETGKMVFPKAADPGDMYVVQYDAVNDHLEMWKWDDSAGTDVLVLQLKTFPGDALDSIAGTIDHQGNIHLIITDSAEAYYIRFLVADESKSVITLTASPAGFTETSLTIWTDNADSAYPVHMANYGGRVNKITDGVDQGYKTLAPAGANLQSPIKNKIGFNDPGGFMLAGGEQGATQTLRAYLLCPYGIALSRGHTSGSFKTTAKTGTGAFERWGILSGVQIAPEDITYDIEDASDVDLVTGLELDADLHSEGVDTSETTIVIQGNIVKTGSTEPYVRELYLSERIDEIDSMTYENEPFGVWFDRLVKITAGEYDLSTSDIFTFVDELGTDHSETVTLEEGVNCEKITVEDDWDSYANIVKIIYAGGETVTIRDAPGIKTYGEFWAKIDDTEIDTSGWAYNRGSTALDVLKANIKRINVNFKDDESGKKIAAILRRGDVVNVKSSKLDTDQTARIIELTRSGLDGERVSAFLVNGGRYRGIVDYWAELDDMRRRL